MIATHLVPETVDVPLRLDASAAETLVPDIYRSRYVAAMKNIRIELRLASPAWAESMLGRNTHNRQLSTKNVAKISDAIARNAWQLNGDCIIFDRNGVLTNGQHRLTAIAAGNIAIPVLVVHGVEPESFATTDQHAKRMASHVLSIEKYKNTATLSRALAFQKRYDEGKITYSSALHLTNDEVLDVLARHPRMPECAAWARKHNKPTIPYGTLTFLYYQLTGLHAAKAESFFKAVIDGIGKQENSHEQLLDKRLKGMSNKKELSEQIEIIAIVFKAWNRIICKAPVPKGKNAHFRWTENEPFPIPVKPQSSAR